MPHSTFTGTRDQAIRAQLTEQLAPLPVGAHAPAFALPPVVRAAGRPAPQSGRRLQRRRAGRRPDWQALVLVFYPMDWEPVSREQLTLYQAYADSFDRLGARLVGISCDHIYSHEAFAHDAQLHFPLLADWQPRGHMARQFGVFREGSGVCARALFVLDAQQYVRFGSVYPDPLNPGVDAALTILEALAKGDETEQKR
jgi:alkyl hydroperoxide reductase subunit AhpC